MNEWIKCNEQMPEIGRKVLIYDGHGDIYQAELLPDIENCWVDRHQEDTLCISELPSHWMPLPMRPND